jgi:heterodisulfide reductase subunit A
VNSQTDAKVGVFICKCGANINSIGDCENVRGYASQLPGVTFSICNDYLCSPEGLSQMREEIKKSGATSIVIAACTPRICEKIFRDNIEKTGLNRNMLQIANIREQCSWVHANEPFKATEKAKNLVKIGVNRAKTLLPAEGVDVELKQEVLVIGGGVAGVEAAYKLAELGFKVHLVERKPMLGGNMATMFTCLLWCHEAPGKPQSLNFRFGTFPACDCSGCTIMPKLNDVITHPNIDILLLSEVKQIVGHVGNFKVKVLKKPRFVDEKKCVGCGNCAVVCPVVKKNEYDYGLSKRKAIFMPYQQALPRKYVIDKDACLRLNGQECSACLEACEFEAPNFEDHEQEIDLEVGAIIIATGFEPYKPRIHGYLGYQEYDNVITIMELERMLDKAGPTGGIVVRPSDRKIPKKIAFIQCVGSRDRKISAGYCSKVCCMYTMKNAQAIKEVHPETDITVYYIDIRAVGKGVEEFFHRTREDYGVEYTRGRPAKIIEDKETKNLIVRAEETLLNKITERMYDLVVLSVSLVPSEGSQELASMLRLRTSPDGFIQEAHTRMKPVETSMEGVFVCGCAQGPKDVPESIAQARAAALEAAVLLSRKVAKAESLNAFIETEKCIGCGLCIDICPYGAPTPIITESGMKMKITEALCRGCGTCVASCPAKAIHARQFTDDQIFSEIKAALEAE